ncbi:hypothetical protein LCGC14_2933460, partial [marine sediment metagenome]
MHDLRIGELGRERAERIIRLDVNVRPWIPFR